ncbi:cytochrome P450 2J6-like [Anneissia japonica]|uniref:cytochrome P450 2J6-like n=1 Tax=Anneissia japonica TaxID=1529436 RepID=UPI0014255ABA|nr:cytochrome P450 2J6-like [Anneissia japonica]
MFSTWSTCGTTHTLVILVVCFCLTLMLRYVYSEFVRSNLPGPRGWPMVGNALSISRHAHLTFTKWAKQYGPVIGIKIGPMHVVVLNDLYAIESALSKNTEITNRPVPGLLRAAFSNDGSLLWENAEKWIKNRKFVVRFLFNFKHRQLWHLLEAESRQLCGTIKVHDDQTLDVCQPMSMAVSNVLCALCFGHRFEYDEERYRLLLSNLNALGKSVSGTTIGHFLPFLYYTPLYRNFRRLAKTLSDFIDSEIDEHIKTYDPKKGTLDLIDMFLKEESDGKSEHNLQGGWTRRTHKYIRRAVIDMFASGTDTTSTALAWAILYMTQHRDKQTAVQKEIDAVMCHGGLQNLGSYYKNLPVTRATLMEVLRHANISPLGLPRTASQTTSIDGHCCPRDTWVFANIWSVHYDEKYWHAPNEFHPERFLSADHKSVIAPKAFMPFGLGKRCCIGEQIAMATMLVLFSKLLLEFDFRIPDADPTPSLVGINGLTLAPKPFRVCAIPR